MLALLHRAPAETRSAALQEARDNVDAVTAVVRALASVQRTDEAVRAALEVVREQFSWAYGSYWRVEREAGALRFVQESGDAGEEFRRVTLQASFQEGVGLSGRAWQARDLVFVPDLG